MLAGASIHDRLIACVGAFAGIAATALLGSLLSGTMGLALAASIGASAVLLFAVPASPLSQPWPIIAGNVVAVLVGSLVVALFGPSWLAAGAAVSLAILCMSVLRCLHPPGGGTALLPLLATASAHTEPSALIALVAFNAAALVASGWLFHLFSGHSYPHRAAHPLAANHRGLVAEDIDKAVAELGETLDVSPEDLKRLLQLAQAHADRRRGDVSLSESSRRR